MPKIQNFAFVGIKKNLTDGKIAFQIRGSGLIIQGGKLITCAHVYNAVPDESKNSLFAGVLRDVSSKIGTYDSYELKLIAIDVNRDIAVFHIENAKKIENYGEQKSIFSTEEEIEKKEIKSQLYFYGFPLANEFLQMNMGVTLTASECIIGAIKFNSNDGKVDFILIDKAVNPGSSGSPVFCGDKVIGLASANINQTHKIGDSLINVPVGIGMVRTSNYILDLLAQLKD